MSTSPPIRRRIGGRPKIVIAGGGFAAVESLLALRDLAPEPVDIDLVAPGRHLIYRPAATARPFTGDEPARFDLAEIAADAGATFRRERLAAVAPQARRLGLASGAHIDYATLILALGTR